MDGVDELVEWARGRGFWDGSLRIEARASRGRCLVAARAFAEGDVVLRVPADSTLAVGQSRKMRAEEVICSLAHRVLEEEGLGAASGFAPYARVLFDTAHAPRTDSLAQLLPGLAGTSARDRATLKLRMVQGLCSVRQGLTHEKAALAVELASTRAMLDDKRGVCAMVPVFDMMNHEGRPNCSVSLDEHGAVSVVARWAISDGEEITQSYTDASNADIFVTYGFALSGDGANSAGMDLHVWLHPQEQQKYGTQMQATLRILGNGAVKQRSAVAPLMRNARVVVEDEGDSAPRAADAIVARAIARCAGEEREQWRALLDASAAGGDTAAEEGGLATLARSTASALDELLGRLDTWLAGPREAPLLAALAAAPEPELPATDDEDTSSQSEGDSAGGAGGAG